MEKLTLREFFKDYILGGLIVGLVIAVTVTGIMVLGKAIDVGTTQTEYDIYRAVEGDEVLDTNINQAVEDLKLFLADDNSLNDRLKAFNEMEQIQNGTYSSFFYEHRDNISKLMLKESKAETLVKLENWDGYWVFPFWWGLIIFMIVLGLVSFGNLPVNNEKCVQVIKSWPWDDARIWIWIILISIGLFWLWAGLFIKLPFLIKKRRK